MESIKKSSLKSKEEVINDLRDLLVLVNDGKEGYHDAAEATATPDLKAFLSQLSGERIVYAAELKEHIALHGGTGDNDSGGVLGGLHRAWLNVKQVFSSNDDQAILRAITTGERAAISKYEELIADYADHADHLKLLTEQKDGIISALQKVEQKIVQA
ncbi:ferritin-like domain-containing protein [Mucilaginibacter polytrichastri]|uniref:DUF2383 domain-containing protein n=1 Tax=Mucilaginibacter polytrichastri TaxID=1302689 RepID=A0A1Q5ZYB3_9SPHI|nr:PA2169 family four-helix-bundle protein [Mucilaginibacter polytrichastri]OKS86737.1 hypothetical protein RG47T_2194 [Mucilaginibacter polytrichastri]SFS82946.1 conserved hypothetical protein [Mucilaginibacter polytrichastri]